MIIKKKERKIVEIQQYLTIIINFFFITKMDKKWYTEGKNKETVTERRKEKTTGTRQTIEVYAHLAGRFYETEKKNHLLL